ncbi:hypothetical protein [Bacillus phage vB_BceS-M2]
MVHEQLLNAVAFFVVIHRSIFFTYFPTFLLQNLYYFSRVLDTGRLPVPSSLGW